jgi:hypothetical protein
VDAEARETRGGFFHIQNVKQTGAFTCFQMEKEKHDQLKLGRRHKMLYFIFPGRP